jgi:hypothetical protein
MRYLFGFMCVLALGVTGCSEASGTGGSGGSAGSGGVGGDGGSGGVCGDGGSGGVGGGVVTDCTGEEVFTACTIDGEEGHCWLEQCATFDCSCLEDGTYCEFAVLGDGSKGVCEAGECTKPQDCTGLVDGWDCNGGICEGGECVAPP